MEGDKKRKGIIVALTNGQAVAFVLVSLMLLGLSFSLGMKAGQSLPDEPSKSEGQGADRLKALDASAQARREAKARAEEEKPASNGDSDAKVAEGTATGANAQASTAKPSEAGAAEATGDAAKKPAPEAKAPEAKPAASPYASTTNSSAAPAIASPNAGARTGFALQTSSIPTQARAEEEVKRLGKRGLSAWYSRAELKDGSVTYRVKVGPYATKDEAMADFDRVAEKAGGKPMLSNAD